MFRRHNEVLVAGALAFAALTGAGCGAEEPAPAANAAARAESPAARQVRSQTERFLSAMTDRDDARACSMMTRELQRGISENLRRRSLPGRCRTRAAHVYSSAKAPGHTGARVKSVVVIGAEATATATAPDGIESEIRLQKVGGRWLIANF